MPEWIRVTMEILNLWLTFCCVILLLVIWEELRSHRADTAKGGGLVLRNWYKEPCGSIPDVNPDGIVDQP